MRTPLPASPQTEADGSPDDGGEIYSLINQNREAPAIVSLFLGSGSNLSLGLLNGFGDRAAL
jgi:hypothetical protein